jgi:hypothetical protein
MRRRKLVEPKQLQRSAGRPVVKQQTNLGSPIPVIQLSIAHHASVRYPMAADNEASLGSSGQ